MMPVNKHNHNHKYLKRVFKHIIRAVADIDVHICNSAFYRVHYLDLCRNSIIIPIIGITKLLSK